MRYQKISYALVCVDLIFYFGEAVAFVLVDFVFDHAAALLDCIHDLLSFGLGAAGIMASRKQIQRRFDLVDKVDRRTILV